MNQRFGFAPDPDPTRIAEVEVQRFRASRRSTECDEVAAEEPFEIRVAGRSVAVIMRTPGHDTFLAAGFLHGEGVVTGSDDICSFAPGLDRDGFPQANVLDLRL